NPTGKTVSADFFKEMVAIAKKYEFMVVNDFAYGKINFDGYHAPSFLEIPGALDIGVEFGSFSKSYNMAGLRLGYCAGNEKIIKGLEKIKGYYDYGIFPAIQIAGIIALRDCDEMVIAQAKKYEERRDIVCEGLDRMGWKVEKPLAGMFVWAEIPERFKINDTIDSMEFAIRLLNEANVAVAPGAGFGAEGEGFLRLALVENQERLRQSLRQINRLV
ncbi:aminotransferase class I/II-fold pyridoxal phosphate-dependent enzyme, partial [bacterium]|nr:aminotransferase class I/II-fold pyridoxal phosphate-dependent enzyme [bacterium]